QPLPPSLYADTARPAIQAPPLDGDRRVSVAVIGGGFTGLSAALHLAEKGVDVTVLEAHEPGWGASGRNNGQVIPTLSRPDPGDIEARHGEAGERFVLLLRDCAQRLFDKVREHDIDAEAEQTGWLQPVHSPGRVAIAERRVRQWSRRGAPVELLDAAQMRAMTGSDAWFGGLCNRSGGHINPLALARGLARAAIDAGARICSNTPALDYARRGGRWHVRTRSGTVRARALVLATNAYSGEFSTALAPQLAREVVPVLSWQMATQPIPEDVRASVIPGRQALSDTHGDLYFARFDARHRLVTGGAILLPFNRAGRLRSTIASRLRRLWPQLGEVRIDPVWNGYVGMTDDFMPRFHRLGPDAWGWVGCNGRAVALSVALGGEFAKAVCGTPQSELALPFTEPAPLPMLGAARTLAPLMLLHYRRMDRREV
ncbi:MAG: NAD(P)/FAD-dependent oxidoreductase, partial [Telluria sp.]